MSKIQLTKKEATQRIDQILAVEFEKCVIATSNYILEIAYANYEAKRKKISGRISVGLDLYNPDDCTVNFHFNKKEIVNLWAAAPGRNDLATIERFTKEFDLFAMDYENIQDFSFRFFDGWFGFPTKTFRRFQRRLKEILTPYGIKVSFGKGWITSVIKVKYSCNLLKDFKPQDDNLNSDDETNPNELQSFIKEVFIDTFGGDIGEEIFNASDTMISYWYQLNLSNFNNRKISFGVIINPQDQAVAVSASLGYVPQDKIEQAKTLMSAYDSVKENRFTTELTDAYDNYDGQLMLMKYWTFENTEFLAKVIQIAIPAIVEQCKTSNIAPFINVTYELN